MKDAKTRCWSVAPPAGDKVPANLLCIELQLDAPRREPMELPQVRLLNPAMEDAAGNCQ